MPEPSPDWFSGLFLPVTTPFDPETGDIAPVSLRENLRQYAETPIDGIVLFGSTGEGVLVSDDEKLQLIGYARDVLPASLPIIAGVGADSTRDVVARIKRDKRSDVSLHMISLGAPRRCRWCFQRVE